MNGLLAPAATLAGPEQAAVGIVSRVVGEAVWAPSVHNTQPWWFTAGPGGLCLYADRARQLTAADPDGREMLISCGAALFTARLALRVAGWVPETQVLPDPARPLLVARLGWHHRSAPVEYERRLYAQVRLRRSHRGGFDPLPLAPQLLAVLQQSASRYGAMLRVVTDEGTRAALADAVQAAEHALRLDSALVRERTAWASPPGSIRLDGVPPTAYPARAERTFPHFPAPDFALGRGWGLPPLSTIPGRFAGTVCLLATTSDTPADWIGLGQALQRILLTNAAWGVATALHSQPFELRWPRRFAGTRPRLYPHLLLRMGTTVQAASSVRRPPASVLLTADGQPVDPAPPGPSSPQQAQPYGTSGRSARRD